MAIGEYTTAEIAERARNSAIWRAGRGIRTSIRTQLRETGTENPDQIVEQALAAGNPQTVELREALASHIELTSEGWWAVVAGDANSADVDEQLEAELRYHISNNLTHTV